MPWRSSKPGNGESFVRSTIFRGAPGWARRCCAVWRLPTRWRRSSAIAAARCGKSWVRGRRENLPLFADAPFADMPAADASDDPAGAIPLPSLGLHEQVVADYQTTGFSLRAHPLVFEREKLAQLGVVPAARLATLDDGCSVRVAGLVLVRQRPATASGITFVTLEDETGVANLIVRPDVWGRFFEAASRATILVAHGRLQRQDEIVHVLVKRLEDFSPSRGDIASRSRDFR